MKITWLLLITFITCMCNACDTDSQQNAIQDKIYNDQFDAINKAKQVENVLLDSAQKQREAINNQSGQ